MMEWAVAIPLRDGVELSATLYLPENRQNVSPVIFVLTPYIRQIHHDQGVYFATHGYPFLTVDVRGRGDSQGEFHPLNEATQDAHDIVEWIARQPYCNGKVAMWGGSYSGYVQWMAAKECPAHLSTIVPVASPYRGVDGPMRNNIFATYRVQWLTLLVGRASQEKIFADQPFWNGEFRRWIESGLPFKALDKFVGVPSAIFQEWISHPELDAYWDSYNPSAEQYARISIPILTVTGAYDTNQLGALLHYRQHLKHASPAARAQHYLIIGPWDHAGTRTPRAQFGGLTIGAAGLIDMPKLHLEWYAWTMQAGPRPPFLQKNVAYYVMGAERWRYADTLENITARSVPFYLRESEPDRYIYDPCDVSLAGLESTVDPASLVDQRMIHASSGKQLICHSAPFERDTEVSGFFKLTVWLSIDRPDTDFIASVYEIGLDGGSILLTQDVLRARYRESLRAARLIETTEPLRYDFERFTFVSRLIEKGCRLRLVIGPLNSIFWQKNYNSGGVVADESMQDAHPVTVKLFCDASCPSALHIPFGHPEA